MNTYSSSLCTRCYTVINIVMTKCLYLNEDYIKLSRAHCTGTIMQNKTNTGFKHDRLAVLHFKKYQKQAKQIMYSHKLKIPA